MSKGETGEPESGKKARAVFLDRDGTLNVEKHYLHRLEDFEFIPGAVEGVSRLKQKGFLVFVVTNQSGVARGYFGLDDVERLHRHVAARFEESGILIDGFYVCPHHPTEGDGDYGVECNCRKGQPGLLLKAAEEHSVDLSRSFMIGDKEADIEAGERAGCTSLLVLTGYGRATAAKISPGRARQFSDLAAAADWILETGCS
ncbi:MAG: D-glycero-beta-D-manno-heptose 1,7-bisphosphate 7-phosphatase [Syntrophotaleaceae bacterium]